MPPFANFAAQLLQETTVGTIPSAHMDVKTGLLVIGASAALFSVVLWIVHLISWRSSTYKTLSRTKQIEWIDKWFSTVHSPISGVLAIYVCCTTIFGTIDPTSEAFWYYGHPQQVSLLLFTLGYAIVDSAYMLAVWRTRQEPAMFFHHLMLMYAYARATFGDYTAGVTMAVLCDVVEVTTINLNIRYFLTVSGLKRTKRFIVNGITFAVSYFLVRVVYGSFLLYVLMSQARHLPGMADLALTVRNGSIVFCGVATVFLGYMWMVMIVAGLMEYFGGKKDKVEPKVVEEETAQQQQPQPATPTTLAPPMAQITRQAS